MRRDKQNCLRHWLFLIPNKIPELVDPNLREKQFRHREVVGSRLFIQNDLCFMFLTDFSHLYTVARQIEWDVFIPGHVHTNLWMPLTL